MFGEFLPCFGSPIEALVHSSSTLVFAPSGRLQPNLYLYRCTWPGPGVLVVGAKAAELLEAVAAGELEEAEELEGVDWVEGDIDSVDWVNTGLFLRSEVSQ